MTTTSSSQGSTERAWAAEQLGLTGDDAAAQRASLARQLRAHGFLPPTDWQSLARVALTERPPCTLTSSEGLMTGHRDVLRQEVEELCALFFRLEPAERRQRQAQLTSKCAGHPPLLARLNGLAGGLDLPCEPLDNKDSPEVKTLAELARKLFLLRPHDRAIAREAFLNDAHSEPRRWADAARMMNKAYPEIAVLDGPLLDRMIALKHEKREIARAGRRRKQAAARAAGSGIRPALKWPFVALISVCIAAALMSDTKTTRRRNRGYPGYLRPSRQDDQFSSPTHALDELLKSGAKPGPNSVFELDGQGHLRFRTMPKAKPKRPTPAAQSPTPIETQVDSRGSLQPRPDWAKHVPGPRQNRSDQLVMPKGIRVPDPIGRRSTPQYKRLLLPKDIRVREPIGQRSTRRSNQLVLPKDLDAPGPMRFRPSPLLRP